MLPPRRVAIQAFAAAIVGTDAASQDLLISCISAALANIANSLGCDTAMDVLTSMQGTTSGADPSATLPAVSQAQMLRLCSAVSTCPATCANLGLGA